MTLFQYFFVEIIFVWSYNKWWKKNYIYNQFEDAFYCTECNSCSKYDCYLYCLFFFPFSQVSRFFALNHFFPRVEKGKKKESHHSTSLIWSLSCETFIITNSQQSVWLHSWCTVLMNHVLKVFVLFFLSKTTSLTEECSARLLSQHRYTVDKETGMLP